MSSSLREGWKVRKLGDVCDFQNGFAFKSKDTIELSNTKLIRMGNLYQNKLNLNRKIVYYPDVFATTYDKYLLKENDLIISLTGTAGKEDYGYTVKIPKNNHNLLLNQRIAKIVIKDKKIALKDYLFHFLLSRTFLDELYKTSNGTRQANLSTQTMKNLLIFMPIAIKQQKQIVATLDKVFSTIDIAKKDAKLNLQNAKELFESYLQGVFENRGDGWEERRLGELTTILGDGLHGTPKYTENGEYHFINGNNLDNGTIKYKVNTKRVSFEEYDKYKKNLTERTIFVSINGTLGNTAFYNNEKIILGKSACYFNLITNIDKNFMKYIILSPQFIEYLHNTATGATIKNVSLKSMRNYKLNFPNLEEQQKIVKKLNTLQEQTKKLESIYTQKIKNLDELKKSMLQKAFSGELI